MTIKIEAAQRIEAVGREENEKPDPNIVRLSRLKNELSIMKSHLRKGGHMSYTDRTKMKSKEAIIKELEEKIRDKRNKE